MRVYRGTRSQPGDPLIAAKRGADKAPAYRGLAYVVFERLPLDDFGNRIPLLQFEVIRPVGQLEKPDPGGGGNPRSDRAWLCGDAGVGCAEIRRKALAEPQHAGGLERLAGLDRRIAGALPQSREVALVVAWFGSDLRAGECRVLPGVEVSTRRQESRAWSVWRGFLEARRIW